MTDTALNPEQAARAEALRAAAGMLRTGNPLAPGALPECRTPSDLTDLAQYIITGADPLAAYRIAPDEAPPVRPTFVEASG